MNRHDQPQVSSDHITPPPPNLVSTRLAYPVDEARALLGGISRKSIYDLINSGELATVMLSGRRLVPGKAIDDLLNTKLSEQKSAA